jgi:hypothetical protein
LLFTFREFIRIKVDVSQLEAADNEFLARGKGQNGQKPAKAIHNCDQHQQTVPKPEEHKNLVKCNGNIEITLVALTPKR